MASPSLTSGNRMVIIIATGAVFICLTMGFRQSFGLFLTPYTAELDIGRGMFSFTIAMQNILWGLASPFFGSMADRRGPVVTTLIGGLCYIAGLLIMALAQNSGTLLVAQIFIGLGLAGAGFSVILGTVGKIVPPHRRASALAVVTAAGSFGQFAMVPIAQAGIETFDPRGGLYMLAGIACLMIVCAPLLKLPADAPTARHEEKSMPVLRVAFASRSYVLLFTGFFVCGFQVAFIGTHLPAFVNDAGLPASTAVTALALVGLCNIIGTLACGWAGDRLPKKNVLLWFYTLRSFVIIGFLLVPTTSFSVILFGALIGFLWLGTVPLTSGLVAVFFGTRHMAMLYGMVFLSHQIGSFLGVWLGGLLFEATGSYDIVWYIAIILGFAAAALHMPIKEQSDETYAQRYA